MLAAVIALLALGGVYISVRRASDSVTPDAWRPYPHFYAIETDPALGLVRERVVADDVQTAR